LVLCGELCCDHGHRRLEVDLWVLHNALVQFFHVANVIIIFDFFFVPPISLCKGAVSEGASSGSADPEFIVLRGSNLQDHGVGYVRVEHQVLVVEFILVKLDFILLDIFLIMQGPPFGD